MPSAYDRVITLFRYSITQISVCANYFICAQKDEKNLGGVR